VTRFRRSATLVCSVGLATLACSVTVDLGSQQLFAPQLVPTMVAQTIQAFTQQALSSTPTNLPSPTSTPTPANAPVPATLSVSVATNCYAGPRTNYGFVITIYPGTIVTVVGRDVADNSWIIDVPGYPGTLCWLSGQHAAVTGETGRIPEPATPAVSNYTLGEPRNLRTSCSVEPSSGGPWSHDDSEWTVVFRWTNTDSEQTGVRVYRNGRLLAALGAHASSYTDTFVLHNRHHGITYGVQAFGGTQVSSIVTIDLRRCD
jgi:hypothetical protein